MGEHVMSCFFSSYRCCRCRTGQTMTKHLLVKKLQGVCESVTSQLPWCTSPIKSDVKSCSCHCIWKPNIHHWLMLELLFFPFQRNSEMCGVSWGHSSPVIRRLNGTHLRLKAWSRKDENMSLSFVLIYFCKWIVNYTINVIAPSTNFSILTRSTVYILFSCWTN